MNNLLSSLLIKLAQKDIADKDLFAMVESLDIIAAAILASLPEEQSRQVVTVIDTALIIMKENNACHYKSELELLESHVRRVTDVLARD